MSNNKGIGGFAGKGYYIALILCAAAIGIMSYVYYRGGEDRPEQAAAQETWADVAVGTAGTEDVPVLATQPRSQTPAAPTDRPETAEPAEKKTLKTVSPVSGEEIFGYSMEALSYNQTTRDWRVHSGVDLAAEAGSPVVAAADGEVYQVYEDDALGYTVTVRHSGGYTTCYSSLTEDIPVSPGDAVTAGQTVGYAGETAIVETCLGAHVHFAVTCYGESVDPAAFLCMDGS